MVCGLPLIKHAEQVCDTCVVTNQRRWLFPQKAKYRAEDPLELVHADLCGPVTPATPGGRRYFLLMVDDASRFMWVALLPTKDAAADAVKLIKVEVEKESGHALKVLRTDNGGEFTVAEFADYCAEEGVRRHFSAPHSPQQNRVVERRNQTVVATARALLRQRRMPDKYWGEAVVTAVHLLNRSPTKSLLGKTPYEAWHGCAPSVSHLKVFGCVTYVKDMGQLRKLDDRGKPGVFIGYAEGAKAYQILDPTMKRVMVSRDVVFDEGRGWDWSTPGAGCSAAAGSEFTVELWTPGDQGGAPDASSPASPAPREFEEREAIPIGPSARTSSSSPT
jgi:hypothetical protein